jgi:hypothetical protein
MVVKSFCFCLNSSLCKWANIGNGNTLAVMIMITLFTGNTPLPNRCYWREISSILLCLSLISFYPLIADAEVAAALDLIQWHTHTRWVRLPWTSDRPIAETFTLQKTDIYNPGGIRTHNPFKLAAANPRLRPRGHQDGRSHWCIILKYYLILLKAEKLGQYTAVFGLQTLSIY